MNDGLVIVLNGASSSGKTTLAQALQRAWGSPLHHVQLDAFRAMEPPGYWQDWQSWPSGWVDERRAALCQAMYAAVRAWARHGLPVVLDTVLDHPQVRHVLADDLSGLPVFLVGVHCTTEQLCQREQRRGDRDTGLAARQAQRVHRDMPYDVEVSSDEHTPDELAKVVIERIGAQDRATAFDRLRQRTSGAFTTATTDRR